MQMFLVARCVDIPYAKVAKWAGWVPGQNGQFISNSLEFFNEFNMIRKLYCCNIYLKNKASYDICIQKYTFNN